METQTQTITAPLPVIHDLARIAALYASDDAQRHSLHMARISATPTGLEMTATDAYALAVWTITGDYSLTEPATVNAHDLHKATSAALKAIGKRNTGNMAADLTITPDTWTLTAGPLTTTNSRANIETPAMDAIRETMNPTAGATFEPYHMGAFQLARLAKTNPDGPDARITHGTYHNAQKPMTYATEYEISGHTITVQILAMPRR